VLASGGQPAARSLCTYVQALGARRSKNCGATGRQAVKTAKPIVASPMTTALSAIAEAAAPVI
jgi:hypothetical protein